MPDDNALAHRVELVPLTQPRRQQLERIHLLAIRLGKVEVARDANANRIFVVVQGVRTDSQRFAPLLNRAVLANDVVIANARPTVDVAVKLVNFFGGRIFVAVGKARVVN